MSWGASLGWTLLRALVLSMVLLPVAESALRWVCGAEGTRRSWRGLAVLTPFLIPELVIGYGYAPWFAGRPWPAELACWWLMGLRLVAVGVVGLWLTPPSEVTLSAVFLRSLQTTTWSQRRDWLRLAVVEPVLQRLPAMLLMTLIGFQQFELAALLKATSWTDWLYVQQVYGLDLASSLRAALAPIAIQMTLLVAAWMIVARRGVALWSPPPLPVSMKNTAAVVYVVVALVSLAFPLMTLASGLPEGLAALVTHPPRMRGLSRELGIGLVISLLASLLAWEIAGRMILATQRREVGLSWPMVALWLVLLAPGLSGSLILGLSLLAVSSVPGLGWLAATPLLWLLGLVLWLLPRAVLLQVWLSHQTGSPLWLAELLARSPETAVRRSSARLCWRLVREPRTLAVMLLVWWSYLEMALAYLLAPVGMPSGIVRLYNFMHFGRADALSAEVVVLLAGPVLLGLVVAGVLRGWSR